MCFMMEDSKAHTRFSFPGALEVVKFQVGVFGRTIHVTCHLQFRGIKYPSTGEKYIQLIPVTCLLIEISPPCPIQYCLINNLLHMK